jgi:hypothetical protein
LAGEPRNVVWPDARTLQWGAAVRATDYNVYRGVFADLPKLLTADADSCARLNTVNTSTGPILEDRPPSGSIYWYLVRGHNGYGEGTAGRATTGPRNQSSYGACP